MITKTVSGDVVISLSRIDSQDAALLDTTKCHTYVKTAKGYKEIGLIQRLKLRAKVEAVCAKLVVTLPDPESIQDKEIKASICQNIKMLQARGAKVKLIESDDD